MLRSDTEILDWLNEQAQKRHITVNGQPKIGAKETPHWLIHLAGVGYLNLNDNAQPNICEAVTLAMDKRLT